MPSAKTHSADQCHLHFTKNSSVDCHSLPSAEENNAEYHSLPSAETREVDMESIYYDAPEQLHVVNEVVLLCVCNTSHKGSSGDVCLCDGSEL